MARSATYTAGIVHYGSDPGLADCLRSLADQSQKPDRIIVVDHDDQPAALDDLRQAHPGVEWISSGNAGYAAGANQILARSELLCPGADFVLILNPDVRLEPDFAAILLEELAVRPAVALASGKLLRPGGGLIDSAGISVRRTRRFRDRGSEQPDDGRFGRTEPVFAVSGAALMLRTAALPSLTIDGEVFDEDFFVYHEDTDLAWRARRLGFESLYVANARAVHQRGWQRGGRQRVSEAIRRHSFKNRYLEMIKNERPLAFVRDLPFILPMEVARFGFAVLADRAMLGAYGDAARYARRAWRKRRVIRRNARAGLGQEMGAGPVTGLRGLID